MRPFLALTTLVFVAAVPARAMTVRYSEGASAVLTPQHRELIQLVCP